MSFRYPKLPKNISTLVDIYSGVKEKHPMILQEYLWDFREQGEDVVEKRSQELVHLANEIIKEE